MMTVGEAFKIASGYFSTGQLAAAEYMYHYVLNMDPNHAAALHALGKIALQSRDLNQAIVSLRRATERDPANAAYWADLGVAYCKRKAFPEAAAACEEALRLRPDDAVTLSNLGVALLDQGKYERAVAVLEEAIRLRPAFSEAYGNLGTALKCLDRPQEALAVLDQAIRLNPNNADAANTAGIIVQRERNLERAIAYYQHALCVRPDYADAMNNLATAYKEKGDLDQAVAYYRETLRIKPDHVLAYYNLSEFAAEEKFQFQPTDIQWMRTYIANEQMSPLWRSVVGFALGAVLDVQGAYDEAFRYYERANELRRTWLRANKRGFDTQRHCNLVSEVIATFDAAYFKRFQGWGTDTERPIFILGMARSGTTLVGHILASHPAVFGAEELGEVPRLMAEMTGTGAGSDLAMPVPFPNPAVAADMATRYLQRIAEIAGGAARVTDKTLENFVYLGLLATLFPRARVIYCRRDPRDVCLSCYFHNFQGVDYSWYLKDIAVYYRQYERLMSHWADVLPLPIHEVHYEDLIADQEDVTRNLLTYCGLDWDERCLTFYNTRRAVQTASTIQVRKPLSTKSIGRWKNYRAHLGPLLAALAEPMEAKLAPNVASPVTN